MSKKDIEALDAEKSAATPFERIMKSIGQAKSMVGVMPDMYRWKGNGPEPDKWTAEDGTIVYSSYTAYVMD